MQIVNIYPDLQIEIYPMPVLDSRMYIVFNKKAPDELLIIDPINPVVGEHWKDSSLIRQASNIHVFLTHAHFDHICGVNLLRTLGAVTVYASQTCADKISDSHKNLSAFTAALVMDKSEEDQNYCKDHFDFSYTCKADIIYETEYTLHWGSYTLQTICTPGHSDCSQCIILTKNDPAETEHTNNPSYGTSSSDLPETPMIVFTGDSLVNGHEVITRLPSGSKKDYQEYALPFLKKLPDNTAIMPGHGQWATKRELNSSLVLP